MTETDYALNIRTLTFEMEAAQQCFEYQNSDVRDESSPTAMVTMAAALDMQAL
jgi:hypothetical protein